MLRRSFALLRERAEELTVQGEPSRAEAQSRTTGGSTPRPSTPSVASPPGAARLTSAQDVNRVVNRIVSDLQNAGVDLADTYRTLSNIRNGNAIRVDTRMMGVLQRYFPNILIGGVDNDRYAVALQRALGESVSPPSRATPAPSRAQAQPQPRATGGLSQRPLTPPRGTGTNAPTRERQTHHANARPSGTWVARMAGSGIDMSRLRSAIENNVLRNENLPNDIRHALNRAGIDTHIEAGVTLVEHPLLQLHQELVRAASARNTAGGTTPPRSVQRADRPPQASTSSALAMLERGPSEDNGQFAWRLYNRNPGVSVEDIASAVVRSGGNRHATIDRLKGHIKTYEKICAAFNELHPISKADAERMGFKDAAIYNQEGDGEFSKDLATTCLFGEELSLSNPNQHVIGLAQVPSNLQQGYHADVNKDVVFMDMKELAKYLISKPRHPMNNMPLTADNIRDFAFKIV